MALSPYGSTPVKFMEMSTSDGEKKSFMQRHGYDLLNILLTSLVFSLILGLVLLLIRGEDLSIGNIIESDLGWMFIGFLISFGLYGMVIWRSRKQQEELKSELRDIKDSIDGMKTSIDGMATNITINMKAGFDRLEAAIDRLGRDGTLPAGSDEPSRKSPV